MPFDDYYYMKEALREREANKDIEPEFDIDAFIEESERAAGMKAPQEPVYDDSVDTLSDKEIEQLDIGSEPTAEEEAMQQSLVDRGESIKGMISPDTEQTQSLLDKVVPPETVSAPAQEPESAIKNQDVRKYLEDKIQPPQEQPQQEAQPAPTTEQLPAPQATATGVEEQLREKYAMPEGLGDEAIQGAQQKRRNIELMSGIMEGVDTAAAAMTGGTPKSEFYQRLRESAKRPLQEIAERRGAREEEQKGLSTGAKFDAEMDMLARSKRATDPNSEESKRARFLLKQLSPEVAKDPEFQTLTAAEADDAIKVLQLKEQIAQRREAAEARASSEREKAAEREERAGERTERWEKDKAFQEKKALDTELNVDKIRSGAITNTSKMFKNIQTARAILSQFAQNPDSVPPIQVHELSQAVARVASGATGAGGAARSTIKEITPNNIKLTLAKLREKFKSEPIGAGQGKFLKLYDHLLKREMDVQSGIINDYLDSVQKRYKGGYYSKQNPQDFKEAIESVREQYTPGELIFTPKKYTSKVQAEDTVKIRHKGRDEVKTIKADKAAEMLQKYPDTFERVE